MPSAPFIDDGGDIINNRQRIVINELNSMWREWERGGHIECWSTDAHGRSRDQQEPIGAQGESKADDRRTIKSADFVGRFYRTKKIGRLLYVTPPILSPDFIRRYFGDKLAVELVLISPRKSGDKIDRPVTCIHPVPLCYTPTHCCDWHAQNLYII